MRRIVLDTETTGLDHADGHRIIEIGAVEMIERRISGEQFHEYLNPQRKVDPEAFAVHGLSDEFLADKPLFIDKVDALVDFLHGAELVIHNASFDIGFINHELALVGHDIADIREVCTVTDTLSMARKLYPGQRVNLDTLCRRLGVDNSNRALHGALLDSQILAEVYLAMTGGQTSLQLGTEAGAAEDLPPLVRAQIARVEASEADLAGHQQWLGQISPHKPW